MNAAHGLWESFPASGTVWYYLAVAAMVDPPILYKYRAASYEVVEALRRSHVWFSNRRQLNDPYDCLIRLPWIHTEEDELRLQQVIGEMPYVRSRQTPGDRIVALRQTADLRTRIGLMAEFVHAHGLVALLSQPDRARSNLRAFVREAATAARMFFDQTMIFSLSEAPDNHVMWAHYADCYRGFCIGYRVRPDHALATSLRRVKYLNDVPLVEIAAAVLDPIGTRDALVYIKPSPWRYEKEWRIAITEELPGLTANVPLEMSEIIFGPEMRPSDRDWVRRAANEASDGSITFKQMHLSKTRTFTLTIDKA